MLIKWIWLSELKSLPPMKKNQLLEAFGSPENIYLNAQELGISKLDQVSAYERAEKIIALNHQHQIQTATIETYGQSLGLSKSQKEKLPVVLYYLGNPRWQAESAAIIGSRKNTHVGYHMTQAVVRGLIDKDCSINSGMALGIDGIAHEAALHMGGHTQAFLAHGLDQCYPKAHSVLMKHIETAGAVISPFCVGTPPKKFNFIRRNEMMVRLSDTIVLIEAQDNSGSLRTAKFALQEKKKLFISPPDLFKENVVLTDLVHKGAKALETYNVERILLPLDNELEERIMTCLSEGPLFFEVLAHALFLEVPGTFMLTIEALQLALLELELKGFVNLKQGKWERKR